MENKPITESSITNNLTKVVPHAPKHNRRGKASKGRQAEKFRLKKNEEERTRTKEYISDTIQKLCPYASLDELLQSLSKGETVEHRPAEVEIQLTAVDTLAESTVDYLRNRRVEILADDKNTLVEVITLQARAKTEICRRKTPFIDTSASDPFINKVEKHFTKSFKNIAVYLDQIGMAVIDEQRFVPKLRAYGTPAGYVASGIAENGKMIYVPPPAPDVALNGAYVYGLDPAQRTFGVGPITIDRLVDRYSGLMLRAGRKVASSVVEVDLASPGSPTQLVGCSKELDGYEGYCTRRVTGQSLILGTAFQFGLQSDDPWHDRRIANVFMHVDTSGFFTKLLDVNDERSQAVR